MRAFYDKIKSYVIKIKSYIVEYKLAKYFGGLAVFVCMCHCSCSVCGIPDSDAVTGDTAYETYCSFRKSDYRFKSRQ